MTFSLSLINNRSNCSYLYILTKVIVIVSFKEVDNCICNDKASHLRRLCKAFTAIEQDVWSKCLATANAVEHRNKDCTSDTPQYTKLTMISVYKADTIVCLKHIAAEEGVSLSYRSRSEEARRTSVKNQKQRARNQGHSDISAQFGPCNHATHFTGTSAHSNSALGKRNHIRAKKLNLYQTHDLMY